MSAARFEDATVTIDGTEIRGWTSYEIDSDLMTPADAFSFELTAGSPARGEVDQRRELISLCAPGRLAEVHIGDSLQMKGRIDSRQCMGDVKGGFALNIRGRDLGAQLVDSSVDLSLSIQNRRLRHRPRELVPVEVQVRHERFEVAGAVYHFPVVRFEGESTYLAAPGIPEEQRVVAPNEANAPLFINEATTLPPRVLTEQPSGENVRHFEYRTVPPVVEIDDVPFIDLCRRAVEPWGMEVIATTNAARSIRTGANLQPAVSIGERQPSPFPTVRTPEEVEDLRVNDAKPRPGETVWGFLDRHARRLGILLTMSPDGKVMLTEPDYSTGPLYSFIRRFQNDPAEPNNIISGGRTTDYGQRVGSVLVLGRGGGRDVARNAIKAVSVDPEFAFVKELVVHDPSIRSSAEAARRGLRELGARAMNADTLQYIVPGHGQTTDGRPGDFLFAVDTCARVIDDVSGVSSEWYVYKRTFTRSASGTQTRLGLMPKGALVL